MKKQISILFLALLLSPILFESVNGFFGHQHEICSADGIHYHEITNDCPQCMTSKIKLGVYFINNSEDILNISYNKIKNNYSQQLSACKINLIDSKRGPPSKIS
jgi:hypothetical protein|tara:strand:+ start:87 stop:398 length:312 start_codon:yes stop_codon:yes gene_type:complete